MSQENVEIVRAAFAELNRGDFSFTLAAPDARADLSRAVGMDRSVYSLDEFRRLSEEFTNSWESVRYEADEFIDAGEHVVTPWTNHLRGRDGIELQARGTWLWTIRDGVIVRLCLFQELQEALEAAGLSE
jgi:ketosteroid isomerase-like protein